MEYSSRGWGKTTKIFVRREYSAMHIKRRGLPFFARGSLSGAIDSKVAAAPHFLLLPFPFTL